MRTKNHRPNAAQLRWRETIVNWWEYYGDVIEPHFKLMYPHSPNFQLHHVVGEAGKHNKIHIGNWFILPIPSLLHDPNSIHPLNVTKYPKRFEEEYGTQKEIFMKMLVSMEVSGFEVPFGSDVKQAIIDYRR